VACEYGHLEAVRLLLVQRADMEASRLGGFTPLYIACQERHNAVVGLLLASKADANHATESGLSPFTGRYAHDIRDTFHALIHTRTCSAFNPRRAAVCCKEGPQQ
jgi:ankyrin repeat protein